MSLKNENTPEREGLNPSESLPAEENTVPVDDAAAEPAAKNEEAFVAEETAADIGEAEENAESDGDNDADEAEPEEEEAGEADGEEETGGKKKRKKEKIHRDTRKLRYGGMATALTAVVVVVIVLVNIVANILSDRFPLNLDLTSDKLFTLTDESKEIVKAVDKDVEIVVFAEESDIKNPNQSSDALNDLLKQFYELTRQYDSLSGGKIKTTFVDIYGDPAAAAKYEEYSPTYYDVMLFCGKNRHQKTNFNDMYTADSSMYQYTGQISDYESKVEQVMASSLAMVTSDVTPEVLLLTGHEEDSYTISGLTSLLKVNNYALETVEITGSEKWNPEAVLAVIPAPTKDYSEEEIERLREWLDNDGKLGRQLMVIVNYSARCPNLYQFLNVEYGLEVTDNIIQETSMNRVYQYNGYATFGDAASSDYTSDISGKRIMMPYSRQILTNKSTDNQNSLFNTPLITFPETAKLIGMEDALAESSDTDEDGKEENKAMDADSYPINGAAMATKWDFNSDNEKIETNVIVYGSSGMFSLLEQSISYGEELVLGVTNGVTGNKTAVSISNKPLEKTSLTFDAAQSNIFLIVFVIVIPLALLIVCLVVFLRRRRL